MSSEFVEKTDQTPIKMRSRPFTLALSLLIILISPVTEAAKTPREVISAFQYLNQVRQRAGLSGFRWNPVLEKAAKNHANYISGNRIISHSEKPGYRYFTGRQPGDRAVAMGYFNHNIVENFSAGQSNSLESIDGLMSAIYHRLGFLNPEVDELGIALAPFDNGNTFVYNMGIQELNDLCKSNHYSGESPFFRDICRDGHKIAATQIEQIRRKRLLRSPKFILWPPNGASGISPVFYEEIPDPLPNQSVSGYPISVQLNPVFFENAELLQFSLFQLKQDTWIKVSPLHLLHKRNDPNQKLESNQYALFPLNRLQWGTVYRAELIFRHAGKTHNLNWQFETKSLDHPLFKIRAKNELLHVQSGKTYAVQVIPEAQLPFMQPIQWETPSNIQTDVQWEDKNTMLLTLTGETCQFVNFAINSQRFFRVQIDRKDNLNPHHSYPDQSTLNCIHNQNKSIQGFIIKGNNEILNLHAGKEYWVEIRSSSSDTERIQLQYPENMQVEIKHLAKNMIKIKAFGSPGSEAEFFLQNGKSFRIILSKP